LVVAMGLAGTARAWADGSYPTPQHGNAMNTEPTPAIKAPDRPRRARPARLSPGVLFAIGTGGMLGALARYGIGRAWPAAPGGFPWSTLAINLSGSLLLGVLVTLVIERWPPTRYVRPFAGVGVCGGYTTWSTFMTEVALLVRDHRSTSAVTYWGVRVAAGLAATYAGVGLARLWPVGARRRST
jgi:CrcB protein